MGFNNSTRGVIQGKLPNDAENADFPVQIANIINDVEQHLVLKATTVASASAALTPLVEGMVLVTTTAPKEVYVRQDSAWVKIWPTSYSGNVAPAAGLGANGDVYFQYA